jgi:hypothetical protein
VIVLLSCRVLCVVCLTSLPVPACGQMSGASSLRRSFVFSEWAASNKQTFIFEGAYRQQVCACLHVCWRWARGRVFTGAWQ